MNIIVRDFASGKTVCRPDTTWERENKDMYVPDSVSALTYTPIIFARVCKAGKCISAKFAGRYYEGINFGMLLCVEDEKDGTEAALAAASCWDHSSVLPFPLYSVATLEPEDNEFVLSKDGEHIYRVKTGERDFRGVIENALVEASAKLSLRIGDLVAVELEAPRMLASREDKGARVGASYCENETFDYKIIF